MTRYWDTRYITMSMNAFLSQAPQLSWWPRFFRCFCYSEEYRYSLETFIGISKTWNLKTGGAPEPCGKPRSGQSFGLSRLGSRVEHEATRNVKPRESGGGYDMIWLFYFVVVAVIDVDLLLDILFFPGYKNPTSQLSGEFPGFHLATLGAIYGNVKPTSSDFSDKIAIYNIYKILARSYKAIRHYKTKIVRATKPMRRNIWVIPLLRSGSVVQCHFSNVYCMVAPTSLR